MPSGYSSFVVIFGAIIAAAVTFSYVRANLDDQREQAWEDLLWTSSQLEIEFLRFSGTLALLAAEDAEIDREEVIKRFDILWSRVNLFTAPRILDRLTIYNLSIKPVDNLLTTLKETEGRVFSLVPWSNDGS